MIWLIYILIVAGLVLLYVLFDRRRYRGRPGGGTLRPTGETFRDPGSGKLLRVWEDPRTGQREYREEG